MVVVWREIETREKFWVERVVGNKTRVDARGANSMKSLDAKTHDHLKGVTGSLLGQCSHCMWQRQVATYTQDATLRVWFI